MQWCDISVQNMVDSQLCKHRVTHILFPKQIIVDSSCLFPCFIWQKEGHLQKKNTISWLIEFINLLQDYTDTHAYFEMLL